jgi:hypothetical protein
VSYKCKEGTLLLIYLDIGANPYAIEKAKYTKSGTFDEFFFLSNRKYIYVATILAFLTSYTAIINDFLISSVYCFTITCQLSM